MVRAGRFWETAVAPASEDRTISAGSNKAMDKMAPSNPPTANVIHMAASPFACNAVGARVDRQYPPAKNPATTTKMRCRKMEAIGADHTHAQRDEQNQPFRLALQNLAGNLKTDDEANASHEQPEQPAAKKQHAPVRREY